MSRMLSAFVLLPLAAATVYAAEPVRRVGIEVQPFYRAARTPDGVPDVSVGTQYNALLASNKLADILAARDLIVAKPGLVTPMVLMVLAIRFYDTGQRDEAVLWFYVAKDRYAVMADVLDVNNQLLMPSNEAMRNFSALAGPVINGYAFCDLVRQKNLHARAVAWVETHPYEVMFLARAPALPGDRAANAARAIGNAKERAAKESAYFSDAKNLAEFMASRKRNEADVKFCWK